MTPEQLQNQKIAAHAMAQEIALEFLVSVLRRQPEHHETLRLCAAELRRKCIERTIPGADPNVSMLIDGETQQALLDLESFLLEAVNS